METSTLINILIVVGFLLIIVYKTNSERLNMSSLKLALKCGKNLYLTSGKFTIDRHVTAKSTPSYTQKIPFIFFQTGRYPLDTDRRQCILINRNINPEYESRYYTDEEQVAYITKHEPDLLQYYNTLIPPAFKADLFRLVVLYYEGGIYMDDKSTSLFPFSHYIKPEKEFVIFADATEGYGYNGFMASVPGHPIVRKNLDQMKQNIKKRYYGLSPLDPTGPGLMGKCINAYVGRPPGTNLQTINHPQLDILGQCYVINKTYQSLCDTQKQPLINRCYRGYYSSKHLFSNYYGVKWVYGDIYH
jgi:mannosyltransferase OCH1-like enzyme